MSKKIVRRQLDPQHLPALSKEQKAELDTLKSMSEESIDYSEQPPLSEDFWQHASRNPFYKPVKQSVTIRLDADIVAWFKSLGGKYQSAVNQALREYMEHHPKAPR
jgi:uncharacterized protein (DUF4415 family)